jgi:hypothetical protein
VLRGLAHRRAARPGPTTVAKNRFVLEPVLAVIGTVRLRDLDVTDVDRALAAVAVSRSSSTVAMAHLALTRAITRAQAKNLVLRNVSALTGTPPGREGRPSRSMTLAQATALTAAAKAAGPRIHAYVMLSLCTGVRTEEARALRWEHVDRRPDPGRPDPRSDPAQYDCTQPAVQPGASLVCEVMPSFLNTSAVDCAAAQAGGAHDPGDPLAAVTAIAGQLRVRTRRAP